MQESCHNRKIPNSRQLITFVKPLNSILTGHHFEERRYSWEITKLLLRTVPSKDLLLALGLA